MSLIYGPKWNGFAIQNNMNSTQNRMSVYSVFAERLLSDRYEVSRFGPIGIQ